METPAIDLNFHITTPRLYISHMNPASPLHCNYVFALRNGAASLKYDPPSVKPLIPDLESARQFLVAGAERVVQTGWGRYLISLRPQTTNTSIHGDNDDSSSKGDDLADDQVPFSEKTLIPIGTVSMQLDRHNVKGPRIPDVGFNMLAEFHGKGYASEAVLALMQYYRENRGVTRFASITNPINEEARRLLKRLGFQDRGNRIVQGVVDGGKPTLLNIWTFDVDDGEDALQALGL